MRYLIGESHRRIILDHLPRGGRMLEWGSGTTTSWLADRLPDGASLLSVEHDAAWHRRVCEMMPNRTRNTVLLRPPTGMLGPNASAGEERPDLCESYIHAADSEGPFDVILVDGVSRGACIEHARLLLAPGGTIFVHDAQRPWYDRAKATLVAHGTAGSCPDYPGPHLWWGGTENMPQPGKFIGDLPLVVSYYTSGTPYEDEAQALASSLDAIGIEHRITALPVTGSWIENCGRKARVIQDAHSQSGRPVLWLDADARMYRPPTLLSATAADFAIRMFHGWAFGTGTVFFNRSPLAAELLAEWVYRLEREPAVGEQIHLDLAWEALSCRSELHTCWLPPSYAAIFDEQGRSEITPVIEHFQASRRNAPEQRTENRVEINNQPARVARLAQRPREEVVGHTWAPADVSQSVMHQSPSDSQLPDPIKHAMADRLALELAGSGFTRVAVYGAGHAARATVAPALYRRGLSIEAVMDDRATGDECLGLVVQHPSLVASDPHLNQAIDAVVLASDAHEDALASNAAQWFADTGVPVYRVFGWQANPSLAAEHARNRTTTV